MASDPPCCEHDGILGGTTVVVPEDPAQLGDEAKLVGCNRLFCITCRSWVRHLDDTGLKTRPYQIDKLYFDPSADPALDREARGRRVYTCRCTCLEIATTTRNRSLMTAEGWRCAGHPAAPSKGGAEGFHKAVGSRATRTVPDLDSIEPELAMFVRGSARWLDPRFPRHGTRGPKERGQWKDDNQVPTLMQLVREQDAAGRGLEFVRTVTTQIPGGPHEGAYRVVATGLAEGVKLELWWSIVISHLEIRGTDLELIVAGENSHECLADFRTWFGPATEPPPDDDDDDDDDDSNVPWQLLT